VSLAAHFDLHVCLFIVQVPQVLLEVVQNPAEQIKLFLHVAPGAQQASFKPPHSQTPPEHVPPKLHKSFAQHAWPMCPQLVMHVTLRTSQTRLFEQLPPPEV